MARVNGGPCLPAGQRLVISADRRGGRVAEGGGLLNRYTV
jgi:hypothetical protein